MFAWLSTGTELRRFTKGTLPRLAIIVMLFIPLLYGALYLWAFWDPVGNMNQLPVALVNEDVGATQSGERVHYGDDVAKKKDLWNSGVEAWLPQGPEDPSVVLVKVDGDSAEYWESPGNRLATAFSFVKAKATGDQPDTGDHKKVDL